VEQGTKTGYLTQEGYRWWFNSSAGRLGRNYKLVFLLVLKFKINTFVDSCEAACF